MLNKEEQDSCMGKLVSVRNVVEEFHIPNKKQGGIKTGATMQTVTTEHKAIMQQLRISCKTAIINWSKILWSLENLQRSD